MKKPRNFLLLAIVVAAATFIMSGLSMSAAGDWGIALGQQVCLVNVQHSNDSALLEAVKREADSRRARAHLLRVLSVLTASITGILITMAWLWAGRMEGVWQTPLCADCGESMKPILTGGYQCSVCKGTSTPPK